MIAAAILLLSTTHVMADEGLRAKGVVVASCNSLSAINDLSEADQVGAKEAGSIFQRYITDGRCKIYRRPVMVNLVDRSKQYTDWRGRSVEVWQLEGMNLFTLVLTKYVFPAPPPGISGQPTNNKTLRSW